MRKMIVGNDRHLERCKIENVPALQIEEALISRLKDLSSDRDLVAELVKSTLSGKRESLEHEKSVIAVKEQERRKLERKLKNLYDTISEEDDRDLRAGLSKKAKETKHALDQTELVLVDLKREYQESNNVVDIFRSDGGRSGIAGKSVRCPARRDSERNPKEPRTANRRPGKRGSR